MKALFAWVVGIMAVISYVVLLAWMDHRDREYLHNDNVTACRPPSDQGEKLVATLSKSADGGPLELHCMYSAKLSWGQAK